MNEIMINRRFELWRYVPSHSQLVYISKKDRDNPTRKILVFKHVKKINTLTWFFCISIKSTVLSDGEIFELLTEGESQKIEAISLTLNEDNSEYDAPIKELDWVHIDPA